MSDPVLQIRWPLGEPLAAACQFGEPILASARFLKKWEGVDSRLCRQIILETPDDWCSIIQVGDETGCLFGDVPGLFFVGLAREIQPSGEIGCNALGLLKWMAAPQGYGLPMSCEINRQGLGRKLLSKTWATSESDYYFFCSDERGEEVLARGDVPIISFRPGICTIDVHELKLPAGHEQAEFELYLFSGTFVKCRWNPPKSDDITP